MGGFDMRTPIDSLGAKHIAGRPRRGHFLLVAVFFTAAAIYGSLVPLQYRPLAWDEAVAQFRQIPYLDLSIAHRADWIANILLFVPLGFLWTAVVLVDRRASPARLAAVPLVVLLLVALSIALEFTQLWFPKRTVSQNDIVAEMIGAVVGAAGWLVCGRRLTGWVRRYTTELRPKRRIDWLLEAYCVGLLIYSVMPLDLTISPAELVGKFRQGKIALRPFADVDRSLMSLFGMASDVLIFVPVGMLAAVWMTSPRRPIRSWPAALALGAAVVVGIEAAQLFVFTRYTSSTDVLTGLCGVAVGAWLMRRWRSRLTREVGEPVSPAFRRAAGWLALAAAYAVLLAAIFCVTGDAALDLDADKQQIRQRFEGFWRIPFAALYTGSEFNALSEILRKMLWYAPLGAMLAMAVSAMTTQRTVRRVLGWLSVLVAAGVSTSIEMIQVLLPPHVPDVTDVMLCAAGAALGVLITLHILAARSPSA